MNQPAATLYEISAATPIHALSAVSLDTETTGLNTSTDRVIQIGAVRITRGRLRRDLTYETLVNPGMPVPEKSTGIHGLTTADVSNARDYAEIKPELDEWIGNAIVVGHSIGFDLAMFRRECRIAELEWKAPVTLDVRHMVEILSPELPDFSLETLAAWLDLPVTGRHQALPDACLTAEVFLGLAPKLMERGIRTLAELQNACRTATRSAGTESRAGWYDFLHQRDRETGPGGAYSRIDSYPYQHRVRDIMSTQAFEADGNVPVSSILSTLMKRRISCAFIRPGGAREAHGILTERDILRAICDQGAGALDSPASAFASFPLRTIPQDAFLYRAMGMLVRYKLRHLGATDSRGNLTGAVTTRNLLKQRSDDLLNLGDEIDHAETEQDLASVWANLALVAAALDREGVDARDIAAVISRELRALTRRCCQIAEQEAAASGLGSPPSPYTVLVLGSGGRGESLLAMDQDNAIVYLDDDADGALDAWFASFGSRVSDLLHNAGVPYCKGNIMGSNPEWRMPVADWKARIETWITRTSPQDILNTDIFFDAVSVHGRHDLMEEITEFALKTGGSSRTFLHLLSTNASQIHSPIGFMGRYRLVDRRMDAKMGGLLPIFSAARVEAIRHGIREKSTPGRLRAVAGLANVSENLIENLVEAHRIILSAILKQQLYDIEHGVSLSNNVEPDKLKPALKSNLKWALEQVPGIRDLLGVPS